MAHSQGSDPRYREVHEDIFGLVMAVMRDDVDGWKTLLLPYIEERPRPEKVGPIGPLIWELARLSSVLAGIAMDAAEPDPGRKKPTKDEFIRILAMRLKETPLPDDLA